MQELKVKVCRGRLHPYGQELPLTKTFWSIRRDGRVHHPCKDCMKGEPARVLTRKVTPLAEELVDRLGIPETISRTGIGRTTLFKILNGTHKTTHKRIARLIILTLYQVRKEMRSENIAKVKAETERREQEALSRSGY